MTEHHAPGQFVAPNLIEADCELIRPEMLTLVELDQQQIDSIVQTVPGGARNVQDIYPLTPLQEGMLFHYLLNEQSDTYVVSTLLEFQSRAPLEALISALQNVIDRHDILRSAVLWEQLPRPVQVVYRWVHLPVEELVLDGDRDAIEQLKGRMTPQRQKWDLRQAPLMRLQVAASGAGTQWYAVLQLHHVICDHGSLKLVVAEAMTHLEGRSRSLPESAAYRTHVAQALAKARTHDAEAFFRGKLGTIDEPTAPFGLLDVHGDGTLIEEARRLINPVLAQQIRTQAHLLGVTAARLFHAAWALVVSRTSGRDDVVFGTALLATRQRGSRAQPMFGNFVNTLPLRVQLHGITAIELVKQVQTELAELLEYEDTSLVVAQRCSGIVGSAPLFSALLTYRHSVPDPEHEWSLAAGIRVITANQFRSNYPITLTVDNLGDGFSLIAQTDRRIDPNRITNYVETAMQSLVQALVQAPKTPALKLSVLPESERAQVIELFNEAQTAYPQEKLIHEVFEEQVRWNPGAVAVVCEGQSLTYAELNGRANQLARYLRAKGVRPDQLVGLCVERSLEMVVGVLGILKAGGGYVPLDPTYPSERLAHMLADAKPKVLLIQESLRKRLPDTAADVITLDNDWNEIGKHVAGNLALRALGLSSHHLAYVIYTSGSTGKPKGVMVEHRNVMRLFAATEKWFGFNERDVWTLFHSLAFDFSVWELWGALLYGGRVVVVPYLTARSPQAFYRLVCEERVTVLNQTPSAFVQFIDAQAQDSGRPHSLRLVIFGGDALEFPTLRPWVERNGAETPRLVNMYGITETTVHVTYRLLGTEDIESERGSVVGKPIPGLRVYVLDGHREPVAIGVAGEMYVGGAGVARGYLNRPELTAERFVPDPFSADPQSRLYKTGDLGRWRADGAIEYLGRNDQQVKIRGFRIELGEIEAQLLQHSQVKEALVLAREDIPGEKYLAAYVVPDLPKLKALWGPGSQQIGAEIVGQWKMLYEETYSRSAPGPSFVGWNSSYNGQPIPEAQMREWLANTVERIKTLHPKRVLEIGCGVGLLLQYLAPQCAVYVGTDFSASALDQLRQWTSQRENLKHVELLHRSATELQDLETGSFDTVVLNSVVQYFPDIEYLFVVLQEAVRLVAPGGKIFIGDVRNLGLLPMFHSAVQLSKAAAKVSVGQLKKRIAQAVAQDKELVIDPQFFRVLPGAQLGISGAEVQLKRGQTANELSHYRYDVTLQVGKEIGAHTVCELLEWQSAVGSLTEFEAALRERRWCAVRLCGIPNQRLAREAAGQTLIDTSDERLEAGALRLQLNELTFEEVNPEKIWEMAEAHGYDVTVSPGEHGSIDVRLLDRVRRDEMPRAVPPSGPGRPWSAYANNPSENGFRQQLMPQLREYLKGRLPEYMVPSAWMVLKQLPLTPNGKVDRRALPAPQRRPDEMGEYIAPRTQLERTLADIWVQLLPVDQVGVQDNFFELGGHSLLVVQLIERLRRLGLSTSVGSVYQHPTLESLAHTLKAATDEKFVVPPNLISPECETITPQMLPLVKLEPEHIERIVQSVPGGTLNIQDIYPLAPLQEGMLFHHLIKAQTGDAYARSLLLSLPSREALENFVGALQAVIDRHDILRTAILWNELPQPVQVVYRQATLSVEEIVLDRNLDAIGQLEERMRPDANMLDLRQAPLVRLQIASEPRSAQCYALLQTHHLIFDNESLQDMLTEVMSYVDRRSQDLPQAVPYRNHVAQALAYACTSEAEAFFRSKLGDIDEPTAPFGLLDVHGDGSRIETVCETLDPALAKRIRAQAQRLSVGAAALFHAAWALVASGTSGRDDVVFGSVLRGRLQGSADAQRSLGMFINTLPLRFKLKSMTAEGLIEQTQQELAGLLNHEQTSLALAQRCSAIAGSAPLFSALLNYVRRSEHLQSELSGTAGIRLLASRGGTNYPILLTVYDQGAAFALEMETDLRLDARRMIGYVSTAMQSLVNALERAPQTPALLLPILPETERHQVIGLFNATQVAYPHEKLIHELIEEQVKRTPDSVAVEFDGYSLTYAELNGRANQLARHLRDKGVAPDQLVGICVERSLDMVVGLLAILKAGGAYVPMDPDYPTERLKYMLNNASPRVLLTQKRMKSTLLPIDTEIIALDSDWSEIARWGNGNLNPGSLQLTSRHLAYVIYTSGSTGEPKGVMNEHRGVVNRLLWMQDRYGLAHKDRVLQKTPFSFDVSVWEFFWTLMSGARLIVARPHGHKDPAYLRKLIEDTGITTLHFVPSMLQAFLDQHQVGRCSTLQHIVCSGEELSLALQSKCFECLPQAHLSNLYGPTEAAVDVTAWECQFDKNGSRVPIGRPISNIQIYVLDRRTRPVPIGVTGEIYIGGTGVARGYLNRPELTAERFIADPFSADPQARLYKTGDLGRWRADGAIEYLGRNDQQVKIRGFRIELGEIEAQLERHTQVKEAVVMAREDVLGEKYLVAYVTQRYQSSPNVEEFRAHLRAVLPEYMVPNAFVILDSLPLTPNGKVDRRALLAPELGTHMRRQYETPQGKVEETLARTWQELLHVERVGRRDSFFELGGHSILALRLLLKVNESFGTTLKVTDIYRSPTLIDLATRVSDGVTADELVNLFREANLSEAIHAKSGSRRIPAKTVLLTGCTGFVGRFLLTQLLRDTDATIHCLVRARSRQLATRRLKMTLVKWDLWRDEFERRVVAIPGDLDLPRLGIDAVTYKTLSDDVDSIYHCATSMNHLETYTMAKPTNVEAVRDLLQFATHGTPKVIHYISTLSIFRSAGPDKPRVVNERSPIEHERHQTSYGYAASKWVGEKLIMTASARGIPCNIFRLGLVWADSQRGRYDELQREYRLLKSCLLSGYGIKDYRYEMAPTPVDYVARAVVYLGSRHAEGCGIFHISSSSPMVEGIFERCNEILGTSLRLVSMYDWICEIKRLHKEGRALPVVPLIEFAFSMNQESFHEYLRGSQFTHIRFHCARTQEELEQGGIFASKLDDDLLRVSLENMLSRDTELQAMA